MLVHHDKVEVSQRTDDSICQGCIRHTNLPETEHYPTHGSVHNSDLNAVSLDEGNDNYSTFIHATAIEHELKHPTSRRLKMKLVRIREKLYLEPMSNYCIDMLESIGSQLSNSQEIVVSILQDNVQLCENKTLRQMHSNNFDYFPSTNSTLSTVSEDSQEYVNVSAPFLQENVNPQLKSKDKGLISPETNKSYDDEITYFQSTSKEKTQKLKHIYRTSSDTYRIQIGKGSKVKPNGKFSRNARTEFDAIWLCELALLYIDSPATLDDMILTGNYKYLLDQGHISSPQDYLAKMSFHAEQMRVRNLLKEDEWMRVTSVLINILYSMQISATTIVNPCVAVERITTMKSNSTFLIGISKSAGLNNVTGKKRRLS